MSKYNNIMSIPIDEIPKEELPQAIKEWAEGDEAMENLLWAFYHNGIKTTDSHAGAYPYIGFEYDKDKKQKLAAILSTSLLEKGSQISARPDGGSPFSGPTWYKPELGVSFDAKYKDEADKIFEALQNTIENNNEQNTELQSFLELYEFLIGKYVNLSLKIEHKKDDTYNFTINRTIYEKDYQMFQELNSLLTEAGLELQEYGELKDYKLWITSADNIEELNEKINKISEHIINNFAIEKPKSIEETSSYITKAHIKRDECLKNGNEKEFDLWLMQESERLDKEAEEARKAEMNNKEKSI